MTLKKPPKTLILHFHSEFNLNLLPPDFQARAMDLSNIPKIKFQKYSKPHILQEFIPNYIFQTSVKRERR